MAMQEGVGRGGYRMLAIVFIGLGILGLASTLYAFQQQSTSGFFNALGFGLNFVALAALFGLVLVLLRREGAVEQRAAFSRIPGSPMSQDDEDAEVPDFEFPEEVAVPLPAPSMSEPMRVSPRPVPAALSGMSPRAPRQFSPVPEPERSAAFERLPPPEMWAPPEQPRAPAIAPPLKRAPSGLTMGEKRAMERAERAPAATQAEEVAIPIAAKPSPSFKVVPTILAKLAPADAEATPDGMLRGKCSQCQTLILAPKNRPINVRCPRCDKVTLLNR